MYQHHSQLPLLAIWCTHTAYRRGDPPARPASWLQVSTIIETEVLLCTDTFSESDFNHPVPSPAEHCHRNYIFQFEHLVVSFLGEVKVSAGSSPFPQAQTSLSNLLCGVPRSVSGCSCRVALQQAPAFDSDISNFLFAPTYSLISSRLLPFLRPPLHIRPAISILAARRTWSSHKI